MASKRKAHLLSLQQAEQANVKAAAKKAKEEKDLIAEILEDAADGVLKHKNRDAAKKLAKKNKSK